MDKVREVWLEPELYQMNLKDPYLADVILFKPGIDGYFYPMKKSAPLPVPTYFRNYAWVQDADYVHFRLRTPTSPRSNEI